MQAGIEQRPAAFGRVHAGPGPSTVANSANAATMRIAAAATRDARPAAGSTSPRRGTSAAVSDAVNAAAHSAAAAITQPSGSAPRSRR